MITPQYNLPLHHELVVDLFAGGGGASTGIEQAIGRAVDVAINHDPEAISLHQANHPQTRHFCSDVFEVDPVTVCDGQPVGLLWASPDCKHFSKAKGGKPVSKKIRSLAWVVVKWAKAVRPRVICLENVEEFQTWGPLVGDKPCPQRKGQTFQRWVSSLRNLGYHVEWRELRACDYGVPTIRKRLFLVARCDGLPIQWPAPTHGDPKRPDSKARRLKPYRTAAECIDWTLPTPSIFERAKPLADATLQRIARGIVKYVIEAQEPFIVAIGHGEQGRRGKGVHSLHNPMITATASTAGAALCVPVISSYYGHKTEQGDARGSRVDEPLKTQTTENRHALVCASLVQTGYGERAGQAPRAIDINKPLGTVVAGAGKHALVSAFLAKHYSGVVGTAMSQPISTVTSVDHHSLVAACISKMRGTNTGHAANEPLHTISAGGTHHAAVAALLVKYYGNDKDGVSLDESMHTIPTRDRFGLVTVVIEGEAYVITDIGMRMLQPHELYAAQGFPASYRIDKGADGKPLSKTAQVRMCGNSVCPPMAAAIVKANYTDAALLSMVA